MEKVLSQIKNVEDKATQEIAKHEKKYEKSLKQAKVKASTTLENGKNKADEAAKAILDEHRALLEKEKAKKLKQYEKKASQLSKTASDNQGAAAAFLHREFLKKLK